ncbi:MAG: holo-ACP synthase [Armatimonadota bacterium]
MEIIGIGTDIIEIERVAKVMAENHRFASRIFTRAELDYCRDKKNCYPHFAARFAAKEAVGKAIGRPISWQDVEVVKGSEGKPEIRLHGEAKTAADGCRVFLTMSHSRDYATAVAVLALES